MQWMDITLIVLQREVNVRSRLTTTTQRQLGGLTWGSWSASAISIFSTGQIMRKVMYSIKWGMKNVICIIIFFQWDYKVSQLVKVFTDCNVAACNTKLKKKFKDNFMVTNILFTKMRINNNGKAKHFKRILFCSVTKFLQIIKCSFFYFLSNTKCKFYVCCK